MEVSQEGAGCTDDHRLALEGGKEEGRASGRARLGRQGLVPLGPAWHRELGLSFVRGHTLAMELPIISRDEAGKILLNSRWTMTQAADHMVSVVTTQLCRCGTRAATGNVTLSGPGWLLRTHSFPNQAPGPAGGRWLALL